MSDEKSSVFRKWAAVGQIVLGVGFAGSGVVQLLQCREGESRLAGGSGGLLKGRLGRRQRQGPLALVAGSAEEAETGGLDAPKTKKHDVENINARVALITKLIRDGAADMELGERTKMLLARKCDSTGKVIPKGQEGRFSDARFCVKEKDCMGEIKAIFEAVRNPRSKYAVRYVRDSIIGDVFTSAKRTLLRTNGGDCDDATITLGAMLMSIGHPVFVTVIRTTDKPTWNHVYLLTPSDFDNPNAPLVALDGSVNKPAGWEAPGAAEVRTTGKPAGIVAATKVYPVAKRGEG